MLLGRQDQPGHARSQQQREEPGWQGRVPEGTGRTGPPAGWEALTFLHTRGWADRTQQHLADRALLAPQGLPLPPPRARWSTRHMLVLHTALRLLLPLSQAAYPPTHAPTCPRTPAPGTGHVGHLSISLLCESGCSGHAYPAPALTFVDACDGAHTRGCHKLPRPSLSVIRKARWNARRLVPPWLLCCNCYNLKILWDWKPGNQPVAGGTV